MVTLAATLADIFSPWSSYYADHRIVSVAIRFLHLAGLLIGGGAALVVDRQVLRAWSAASADRESVLATLHASHRTVVSCLVLVGLTGALMTASDIETFLLSRAYWMKMSAVGLLFLNGAGLVAAERRLQRVGLAFGWPRLVLVSALSVTLWLLALFMGVWLTAAA
jgi:hypothetical protein